MQARNYVDISFTVLERELKGRRLLRDLDTGQAFYDPPEPDDAAENLLAPPLDYTVEVLPETEEVPEPAKPRSHHKKAK